MSADDYWPKGEAYRSPPKDPEPLPLCLLCGRHHADPLPDCRARNEKETPDGRWTG